ncbi:MAG: 6-carboxytetrahydropterin synthase [Cryobacterium sp.]|nr:6-carboxytetrahydropterin synthase [Oligoflexia bacterium]
MSEPKGFYRIRIRKEALKFSAAHMTVFADGTKENLHGHNYRTVLKLEFSHFSLAEMLPFSEIKKAIREICAEWDEKVLLPSLCPFLDVKSDSDESMEVTVCGKRYVFPREEVVMLPIDNVTTESLAKIFTERVASALSKSALEQAGVRSIEGVVEEMLGQGASYVLTF